MIVFRIRLHKLVAFLFLAGSLNSCNKDESEDNIPIGDVPTPYNLKIPAGFPSMFIPQDNPLTIEGVALGRKLFYDTQLSGNNSLSCASCHNQQFAFTDNQKAQSVGVDNISGTRNAMPLFNLGWYTDYFWDGRTSSLEAQIPIQLTNSNEMHGNIDTILVKLNSSSEYQNMFEKAFGSSIITEAFLVRAIAQFERTLISGNARYDQFVRQEIELTAQEQNGLNIYTSPSKGNCASCHTLGLNFTDQSYRNIGLDSNTVDFGRSLVTLSSADDGKFKTPSLRNCDVTGPYMHDGRFATLQACIEFYNTGYFHHSNLDPLLANASKGRLNTQEKEDLISFLKTLTDEEFIANPNFKQP
jgi:cytochrome c peroxidase